MSDEKEQESLPHLDLNANLTEIWNLLRALDKKIEVHITEESTYKPRMLEAIAVLERSKGVVNFIRWCCVVGGGLAATYAWFRSHISFHP